MPSADRETVKLYDATRLMMKATFTFAPGQETTQPMLVHGKPSISDAADRTKADLIPGTGVKGALWSEYARFAHVVTQWGLSERVQQHARLQP